MEQETIVYPSKCKRLYDIAPYIRCFEAEITDQRQDEGDGSLWLALSETAFFPEGGGQAADTGLLETETCHLHVISTQEKEGQVWHQIRESTSQAQWIGQHVRGIIDWDDRFVRMQNHTGEHIVSGLIHEKYGFNNVGFHMGQDIMTIDLDGMIPSEDLAKIEQKANEVIWQNIAVETSVYDWLECADKNYRSKKKLLGEIRIVSIPGVDDCACCGTHVAHTGEIGLIKMMSCVPFRGGVRIEMICGRPAFVYMQTIWQQNHAISVLLSAKMNETAKAVEKLKEREQKVSFSLQGLQDSVLQSKSSAFQDAGNVVVFEDGLTPEQVRKYCVAIMEICKGRAAVFSGSEETGYKYAVGEKDGDLRQMVKQMNADLNGRGGGKPFFAQGSVLAAKEQITDWFNKL